MIKVNLGVGNVVMVEAFNLKRDVDGTHLYVGEIVALRDTTQDKLSLNTIYKNKSLPRRRRSKYLLTMRVSGGSYVRFYCCDIDVLVVVRDKA